MKLTKYAQSCFLIKTEGKRILIDPGHYVDEEIIKKFRNIDLILITHIHNDHCFPDYLKLIQENNHPEILGNEEVVEKLADFKVTVVKEGDVKEISKIKFEVVKAVHGWNPLMIRKYPGPPLTNGFIIRDSKTSVYHCSDTVAFPNDYKTDVLLVPACGFGVVMSPDIAVEFAMVMKPKLTIPMHYDSPKHLIQDTKFFEEYAKKRGLNYKVLQNRESTEF